MKKWESPSVSELHVKDTHETECSCNVVQTQGEVMTIAAEKHPCHKTGNGEHNNSGNHTQGVEQNGHIPSVGCPDPTHYKDGKSNCCCYQLQNS